MSLKLKVLGLGLLAVVATSAFAVVGASATTPPNSHFIGHPVGEDHVIIRGTDAFQTAHQLVFKEGEGTGISCTHSTYHGTLSAGAATTTQSVEVRPSYSKCATENEAWGSIVVHVAESCKTNVFKFTSGNPGTVHLNCGITITHPNCDITVHPQTLSGVTYTNITEGGVGAITMHVNVGNISGTYHNGICIFLGTNHTFTMTGSATVWGENTAGGRVGITHT